MNTTVLTGADVVDYLLRRNLLSAGAVVDAGVEVLDVSSRNRNFAVRIAGRGGFLVKQARDDTLTTLTHEADVYRALTQGLVAAAESVMPHLCYYDASLNVLVLELVEGENLEQRWRRVGRLSVAVATQVGAALCAVHTHPLASGHPVAALRPPSTPAALSLHRPTVAMLPELSAASLDLIRTLQTMPGCVDGLERIRSYWFGYTGPATLCHNDVRWLNYLCADSVRRPQVRLVDWEIAGVADPAWDIGSVFGSFLGSWLLSVPVTGDQPPDHWLQMAGCPLPALQRSIRAFWKAYAVGIHTHQLRFVLGRGVEYAAARLVQTAFEHAQISAELSGVALVMLQVAVNMLARPREAAVHLLGVSGAAW